MKASEKPQLSTKWWVKERPPELRSSELEKAIARVERAFADQKRRSGEQRAIDTCLKALREVLAAATKTIKRCDKRRHKDVITVLKKYDPLVKEEIARLEAAERSLGESAGEDEDDISDEQLFEKDYLYKMMKLIKSSGKELRFGFGLDTSAPESSRLLLKRKGKPELLFKKLKKTKQFSNRVLTYGYAKADPQDGMTLIFRLETGANEPPRIIKLGRKFLRADKKLRFRKLKIVFPGGKTLEDNELDTDDEEQAAAAKGRSAEAQQGRAEPGAGEAERATADKREQFRKARREWVRVRDKAQRDLEVIKAGIREQYMDDREQWKAVTKGIQRLDEVTENLNDDLRDALDTYVSTPRGQRNRLADRAAEAKGLLDRYLDYVTGSRLMAALDQKEFANVAIKAPIEKALRKLSKTIA